MKALTVQQPWAWAIVHGGKNIENRVTGIVGAYRGPLAIHAGISPKSRHLADEDHRLRRALAATSQPGAELAPRPGSEYGALIGVVDLVNEHAAPPASRCCGVWADAGVHHLVLENPRPLDRPIAAKGRLGLWAPPAEVLDQLRVAL